MCAHRSDNTRQGFIAHAQKSAVLFAIVLGIWAVTGFMGIWPVWVLLFCGLKLGAHARRVYSGGSFTDDDADDADEQVDEYEYV
jgi:hypothetical protein